MLGNGIGVDRHYQIEIQCIECWKKMISYLKNKVKIKYHAQYLSKTPARKIP